MKKELFAIGAVLILIGALLYTIKLNSNMRKKWEVAMANVKAYSNELDASKKHNAAFQLTIEQLKTYQDSIFKELDKTRKELKIKDKDLKALQSVKSSFTRTDTITVTQVDTLFKEPSFALDTIIGDNWYNLQLGLKYPSTIAVKPYFKSEKHIIVSSKKETVNPPKKFFLFRWFQKKHRILNVDVVEKNPYVEDENSRFVEIIK